MNKTKFILAGVIGNPISHSLSPLMHETWRTQLGIEGEYRAIKIDKDGFAQGFHELAQDPCFRGANITLPFKGAALELADHATDLARRVGAANLLVRTKNGWLADNTDVAGFLDPLHDVVANNTGEKTALVFGAGGAARAVIHALMTEGFSRIQLCNRTDGKAEKLVEELALPGLVALPISRRNQPDFTPTLIVQSGSAGMTGFAPLDVDLSAFARTTIVYDLVYAPLLTPLLRQARDLQMPHIGGLSMLVAQARPSFAALFGQDAPKEPDMVARLAQMLEPKS